MNVKNCEQYLKKIVCIELYWIVYIFFENLCILNI